MEGGNCKFKILMFSLELEWASKQCGMACKYVQMVIATFIVKRKQLVILLEQVRSCWDTLIFKLTVSQITINITQIQN